MEEFLSQLQAALISALIAVIGSLVLSAWKTLMSFLKTKIDQTKEATKNEFLKTALQGMRDIADDVSASLDPVAEQFKLASSDGKLTPEEIEEIKTMAHDKTYDLIDSTFSVSKLVDLGMDTASISELITAQIEASLQKRKLSKSTQPKLTA